MTSACQTAHEVYSLLRTRALLVLRDRVVPQEDEVESRLADGGPEHAGIHAVPPKADLAHTCLRVRTAERLILPREEAQFGLGAELGDTALDPVTQVRKEVDDRRAGLAAQSPQRLRANRL